MDNMLDTLFGPLDKRFCNYFYILSVIGMAMLFIFVVSALLVGITKRKGLEYYMQMFTVVVGYGLFYFQNRLLHSMCAGTMI